jgi:16S rRNA (uracil1498-N3)-methyltransferase
MNRFFVDPVDIQGDQVFLSRAQAHQISHVLRLRPDDRVIVLDNSGWEYEAALEAAGPSAVTARVVERRPSLGEPQVGLVLYQGLLARDKFEWVLQKCTEVGVTRFCPVVTERSLVRTTHAFGKDRMDRWIRILTEAAEQSHRGRIPQLDPPSRLDQAVTAACQQEVRLLASPATGEQSLREALAAGTRPASVALLVGPEAGFSVKEVDAARAAGWRPFNLGSRILRTETAAVVASSLVLYELGQMG